MQKLPMKWLYPANMERIGNNDRMCLPSVDKKGKPMMCYDLKIPPFFTEIQEIRTGSPYKLCNLQLEGRAWIPILPVRDWQNIFVTDDDQRYLVLVAWNIDKGNNPGFNIFVIDAKKNTVTESPRYCGCCNSLSWSVIGVSYTINGFYILTE